MNGERIAAEVGRNLTLTSEQDSNRYDSKQQSASAGGSFTFGTMTPSGSLNLSKDKMHSTYDSVQEQTGLFAGKGGFDVKVGEHTQLNGAVIGSTASVEHNRLETGTLGFSDIENQAAYKVEHQSVGASTGGGMANFIGNLANGLAVAGNKEKSDSSTTHAAVSDGTIFINDTAKQQQNVDDLSRDVAHANQTLSPIFDKEKEQQRMQTLQLIGEVGNQAADIARTQGDIAGFSAAKAKHPTYTDDQLRETAEFKQASQPFGTGGDIQRAITASTAAIQGLAGGDIAKALAGASAPYLAEIIHRQTTSADGEVNKTANLMAHAVVNAALSLAKGENALAGASSAVTAEAVGMISEAYYDKKPYELSEDEKQKVSALASLAAGLAGGLVGGDTASAVSGMQTGKVTVENNALANVLAAAEANKKGTIENYLKAQKAVCKGNQAACTQMVKDVAGTGLDFVPIVGDIKGFVEAQTAIDYLAAALGVIPGAGDVAGKAIKAAETALKKGDVAEASRLINRGSSDVSAASSLQGSQLNEYYRQAEKYGKDSIKPLDDGRFRFYGNTTPAKTQGEMAGARLVREWDPSTGKTRTWYETLDHSGNVRSVAPKPVTDEKNHHIFDADGNYQGRR